MPCQPTAPKCRRNPAIDSWHAMVNRCTKPTHKDYRAYGARGISVCERWMSFKNFLADMGEKPSPKHQLDRFPDQAGNYEPGNVRWATAAEQARNRRSTRFVEFRGERLCIKDWADRMGLGSHVIRYRLNHGWPIERALTTRPYGRRI